GADASHLETCGECQARFKAVADDARSVATLLAAPEPRVDVAAAFARVTREPKAQPALGLRFPIMRPAVRPALALVAAVAALAFSADKAAAAAASHGKTLPKMPAGMDGATLTITAGPAVGLVYGNLSQPTGANASDINLPQLVVAKSAAPTAASTQVTVK